MRNRRVYQAILLFDKLLLFSLCCLAARPTRARRGEVSFQFRPNTQENSVADRTLTGEKIRSTPLTIVRSQRLDKGFNLLELASGIVPQGALVKTARDGWKFVWQRMMAELAPQDQGGSYRRPTYSFSGTIEKGSGAAFPDEPGRYHLYVGNPCPWCHRTTLAVKLLNFGDTQVGMTRLEDNPVKASRGGWIFGAASDPLFGCGDLRELYDRLSPGFQGRCTAPLLVDKVSRRIVSNESSNIVRILNQADLGTQNKRGDRLDLYPSEISKEIDDTNGWIYNLLNNGVYRCGFATTQHAYNMAAADVLLGLERCELILKNQPYLCGSTFTESDLMLLPTALRFDGAYAPLFKAGGAHLRIRNYSNLQKWLIRCWKLPAVRTSIDLGDACASYYRQLFPLNPGGIVPIEVTAKDLGLVDTLSDG